MARAERGHRQYTSPQLVVVPLPQPIRSRLVAARAPIPSLEQIVKRVLVPVVRLLGHQRVPVLHERQGVLPVEAHNPQKAAGETTRANFDYNDIAMNRASNRPALCNHGHCQADGAL